MQHRYDHSRQSTIATIEVRAIPGPERLGLRKTLEFKAAPESKTFFYKKRVKEDYEFCRKGWVPIIQPGFEDRFRFRELRGPFLYAVADSEGVVRYLGKSYETTLSSRWIRPTPYLHHKQSRDHIIQELRAGRGPLWLWSTSAAELRPLMPQHDGISDQCLVKALEALWLSRWCSGLWNSKLEPLVPGFDDGSYWAR